MKSNIFIPKKINVGFQERSDTYTKKLAYIIYFDEKGKLRKEASWKSWRNEKIDNEIHENNPTSGFVLNKKAGGYSTGWNHRQTYVRVYDPRGFEFEITVQNLLYILENTNSIKGKGLEGDFVYGWDGKDLVLIPTESPDYIDISNLNKIIHEKTYVKAKDLKIGGSYLAKDGVTLIYMGKFDEYCGWRNVEKSKTKSFFFYASSGSLVTMKSTSQKIISVVSDECADNYAELMDKLERNSTYSPVDSSKDEYIYYTLEEIEKALAGDVRYKYVYSDMSGKRERNEMMNYSGRFTYNGMKEIEQRRWVGYGRGYVNEKVMQRTRVEAESIEEMFNIVKPMWKKIYLANGKLYREEK